ncbi:Glutathione-regulated potassium-efflux system protein KefC (K(+)/H(+) antiporter), partial [Durusdinium trenchii]
DLVDGLRKFDVKTFYGDATRPDLLHAAGLMEARQFVAAIDDKDQLTELVKHVRRERPDIHIVARAIDRHHVYQLYAAGANDIIRETFDSAVRAGRSALEALGEHPFEVEKAVRFFVRHDRDTLRQLAAAWKENVSVFENEEYVAIARRQNQMMMDTMRSDRSADNNAIDRAWQPPLTRPDDAEEDDDAARALEAAGARSGDARRVAEHLVAANLAGHDSHGIGLLPAYLKHAQAGLVDVAATPEIVHDSGAIVKLDGRDSWGRLAGEAAMRAAFAKAEDLGACIVTLSNAHHLGRIGAYGEIAAQEGFA